MHHHAERRPDEYRPVLTALARIDDGVMVESLPLPEVPGARTVNDLRALGANGLGAPLWRNQGKALQARERTRSGLQMVH